MRSHNITYEELALDWNPAGKRDSRFNIIALVSLAVMLLVGFILSSVDVPEKQREARPAVPERVAQFLLEKQKPKPKPKPIEKPKPKPKPKPKVKKIQEKKLEKQKPLTKSEKKAREKAKDTGLLALGNELMDLMDTSEINAMVGGKVAKASSHNTAASLNKDSLIAGVGNDSGGINEEKYARTANRTKLSNRELTQVRQSLLSKDTLAKKTASSNSRGGTVRADEELTLVFDQNKGKLYSIYNRARRTNPGLKGKIVLELTIEPGGNVSKVRIVSSELNDAKLERSLMSRIKQFKFEARNVKAITVTYPIEFLPS